MGQSARAAILKHHRLGGFSNTSGEPESKIKVSAGLVYSEVSLLELQVVALWLGPHMAVPLRAGTPGVSLCPLLRRAPVRILAHPNSFIFVQVYLLKSSLNPMWGPNSQPRDQEQPVA